MPIHKYKCRDCGSETELFLQFRYNKETKETIMELPTHCGWDHWNEEANKEGCGSTDIAKQLPNGFGIHGQSTGKGCDARGYFSASLGRYVTSMKEERTIMEKNGFVALSDLGGDQWFDDTMAVQKEKHAAQDAKTKQYQAALQSGKSKEEAIVETFTAKEAASGELEKIYDTAIKH